MSAALAYRAHAPLIDSLLNEVGLSGGSLQGLVPGLAATGVAGTADGQATPAGATPAVTLHADTVPVLSSTTANGAAGHERSYGPR